MAKVNNFSTDKKNLHTFTIDYDSDKDDRRYKGTFTTKRLSVLDLATLGVRKSQLNGGMHHDADSPGVGVDSETDNFNGMVAHLEMSIVSAPDWWDLSQISDVQLVVNVYTEVVSFEQTFLRGRKNNNGHLGSSKGTSQTSDEETDAGGLPETLVDDQVRAALEP